MPNIKRITAIAVVAGTIAALLAGLALHGLFLQPGVGAWLVIIVGAGLVGCVAFEIVGFLMVMVILGYGYAQGTICHQLLLRRNKRLSLNRDEYIGLVDATNNGLINGIVCRNLGEFQAAGIRFAGEQTGFLVPRPQGIPNSGPYDLYVHKKDVDQMMAIATKKMAA